jgi:hypothetical protein
MKNLMPLLLSIPLSIFAQKQAILVQNGKANFTISIAANPTDSDSKAAELLQSSIKKMTHCELQIVKTDKPTIKNTIFITPSVSSLPQGFKKHFSKEFEAKKKDLIDDGFLISVQTGNILILNGGKKGAYYGVVHLLEKYLDCRMYAPNVELMPQKTTISLPILCEMDKPINSIRIVNGVMTQQNEAYRNWQRLNDHNEEFAKGYYVHSYGFYSKI